MSLEKLGVPRLNGSNYASWKFKVELLLVREDLWEFVTGICPAEDQANAAAVATWKKGDQKARATIGLLVDDSQRKLIQDTVTSKEAWDNLRRNYERTTLTSKVSILKKLCDMRYTDGEDIEKHITEMQDLFDRLSVAGQVLDANLQVAMVLRSMPDSFNPLTTALESRSDADLTFDLVKSKLIDEIAKRNCSGGSQSVLKAGTKKQIICHNCHKVGHKQKDCRSLVQGREKEPKKNDSKPQGKSSKAKVVRNSPEEYAFLAKKGDKEGSWIVDSGATSHMAVSKEYFESLDETVKDDIVLANGMKTKSAGKGICRIQCIGPEGFVNEMTLSNTLFVPDLESNLFSVRSATKKGATVIFDEQGCRIFKGEKVVAVGVVSGGLYNLQHIHVANLAQSKPNHSENCQHAWHRKFGHRDPGAVGELEKNNMVTGLKIVNCGVKAVCECCLEGKFSRLPFPKKSKKRTKQALDLVHTDLCGPMNTASPGGCRYFMAITDDFTRYSVVYFLQRKSEAKNYIKQYVQEMKTMFGRPPKVIRSDQGGEFQNQDLEMFCCQEGIRQQFCTSYTPQQNGVSERKNRSLVEMGRCLLLDAKMPKKYWAEAINTACYLQNLLPSSAISKTPFELWTLEKPDVDHLQLFGSQAYVWIPKEKRSKLDSKSVKMTFVGYSQQHKGYRFLDLSTNKIVVSRDARFIPAEEVCETENQLESIVFYPFKPVTAQSTGVSDVPTNQFEEEFPRADDEPSDDEDTLDETMLHGEDDYDTAVEEDEVEVDDVRRSNRSNIGIPPVRYRESTRLASTHQDEPRTYDEAMRSQDCYQWKKAMDEEFASLQENSTWEIVSKPDNQKPIGCKWIFKKKLNESGQVIRYKARLVAQGYSQKFGVDYDEVFAPVAKHTTLRTLLTVAARRTLQVKHIDVKSAYLHGELTETIYMKQPKGYHTGSQEDVCLLKRSIYGLKQAGRIWNRKITEKFKQLGYEQSEADPCLYIRNVEGVMSFILLYVDDMLVVCPNNDEYERVERYLSHHFSITCLGEVSNYLGIQVEKTSSGSFILNQSAYIRNITNRFNMSDAKPSKIPMDPGYPNMQQMEEERMPKSEHYLSLVGALLYIAVCTRPDIAIAASILGRKVSQPTEADWNEAKRTLRYLSSTADLKLHLGGTGDLEGFVDADWAGDKVDRKSNSGFIFKLGSGTISWSARKQQCVSLSSTEAEYVALSEASQELLWLLKLMHDIGEDVDKPVVIHEDNQSCIAMLSSTTGSRRTKHIDTRYNFVKELVSTGIIQVHYCPTESMVADILTKPLAKVKQELFRSLIGLKFYDVEEE